MTWTGEQPQRKINRLLPVVGWLPSYDRRLLRGDVLAGIVVTALIVPKSLGYAGIAGVPVQNGLYAATAGAIIYALFCTSRQISTGPSSGIAAVAGGAVLAASLGGEEAAELVVAITLVTGLLFGLLAVFKLGRIAQFLSKPVVVGFLAGAAVDVTIGELARLTGTETSGDNAWQELSSWIGSLDGLHETTLLVGLISLVVIFGLRVVAPKVPGALVLLVGGLVASAVFDLGAHGVSLVGDVPRGLPTPELPSLHLFDDHAATIFIASVALLLIGFSQTAGDARAFAARHRYRIDVDQESLAQGMANVGAGVFQGMPVTTSLSASSLNESAGARTPLASLITGGFMILTLIALAPLFSELPKPVLAALIIDAVVMGMIDIPEFRRLYRIKRFDFYIAIAAVIGVLSLGVLAGVVVGVALSLAWLVYVTTAPKMPLLARESGTHVFRESKENPDDETFPGLAVVRLDGGLYFATADALHDRLREILQGAPPPIHTVILDLESVDFIDSQGAGKLTELRQLADSYGITLRLARVQGCRRWPFSKPMVSSTGSVRITFTATSTRRSRPSSRHARERPQRRTPGDTCGHYGTTPASTLAALVEGAENGAMSTVDPPGEGAVGLPNDHGRKRRSPWMWISILLGVAAVGLLIWALSTQSDLDDAQSQLDQTQETGTAVIEEGKQAYDDVTQELGVTSEDLAATEEELANAEQDGAKAEKDAEAAQKEADKAASEAEQAQSETEKANAEADKANAEADKAKAEEQAADSKAAVAADCAKAYVSALGKLFEGDSVKSQAEVVKKELGSITATCKAAFGS